MIIEQAQDNIQYILRIQIMMTLSQGHRMTKSHTNIFSANCSWHQFSVFVRFFRRVEQILSLSHTFWIV
jgi:hypothetical protein